VGLSTSPAIQRSGLTGIGHHRADHRPAAKGKPCPAFVPDERFQTSSAPIYILLDPTTTFSPRHGRPGCRSRQPPPASTAIAGQSTDVQGRLKENLQENSGTTHRRPAATGILQISLDTVPVMVTGCSLS
jgi:hypothetical protein